MNCSQQNHEMFQGEDDEVYRDEMVVQGPSNPELERAAAVPESDKNFQKLLQIISRIVNDAKEQINTNELYRQLYQQTEMSKANVGPAQSVDGRLAPAEEAFPSSTDGRTKEPQESQALEHKEEMESGPTERLE